MHGLRFAAAAVLLLAAVPAARARAQAPADSLPFHPGQWGVEAGVGGGGGAGALRFFSRATALTVDVSAAVATRSSDLDGPNTVDSDFSTRFLSTRLGFRHYGSARRGIAGLFGAGAILSYNWANGTPGDGSQHETGVGGFAEAGASYFVTPRLALSGTYGLNLQYTSGNTRQLVGIVNGQQVTSTTSGWVAQTTGVRLTGAIFF
jgi:hypothetical protein